MLACWLEQSIASLFPTCKLIRPAVILKLLVWDILKLRILESFFWDEIIKLVRNTPRWNGRWHASISMWRWMWRSKLRQSVKKTGVWKEAFLLKADSKDSKENSSRFVWLHKKTIQDSNDETFVVEDFPCLDSEACSMDGHISRGSNSGDQGRPHGGLLCLHLGENFTLIYPSIHPSPLFMHSTMWYLFVCLPVCLFVCLLACLLACFLVCLFVCLFVCLLVCLFVCLFVYYFCEISNISFNRAFIRVSNLTEHLVIIALKMAIDQVEWHLWNQHEMLRICFRTEYFTGFILSLFLQEGMTNDTVDEQNPKNQLRSDETSPLNGILYQLASTVSLSETFKSNWMFPKIVVHPNHPF